MTRRKRRKLDAYYSPSVVTQWLLEQQNVGLSPRNTVLEPMVGSGAIARPLIDAWFQVWTNDIDPDVEADYHYDMSDPESLLKLPKFDWIITNPAFNVLNEALPLLWSHCHKGMALFVRKSITEPCYARQDWLKSHERNLAQVIFCPRVSFTGDGKTDNASCDWYIWLHEHNNQGAFRWITK